jgi:fumarate reductase flavoprotein subunit
MRWSFDNVPPALLRPFMMRFLTTALGPSRDLFDQGGVLVNQEGQRFTDEVVDVHTALARQKNRMGWIIFDQTMAARFASWPYFVSTAPGVAYAYLQDYQRTRPDLFHRAQSLDELAALLNMPGAALAATLTAYNNDELKGGAPGRGGRQPIISPPFYALGPLRSYVVFTNGSLDVSVHHEVLDGSGNPIAGLFAAGANGQGRMLLEGHGHHLGWAFTSGRLAGREASFWRADQPAVNRKETAQISG